MSFKQLINQPKTVINPPKVDDPSIKSNWYHHVGVATGCTTILLCLVSSFIGSIKSHTWFKPIIACFIGYIFADLVTGVYHWLIDNFGDASTPIFGSQIEEFQRHHKLSSGIPKHEFENNLNMLGCFITFTVLPIDLIYHDRPVFMGFMGVASGCVMLSQYCHAWAHMAKSKLPPIVVILQDVGVLVSRSQHAAHHRPPYNNNYCIVSGVWNMFMGKLKVFEALEMVVFFVLGVRPRSWNEPNFDWKEDAMATN